MLNIWRVEHLSVVAHEKWPWLVAADSQIWQNSLHWADVLVSLALVKIDTLMEGVCLGLLDVDLDHTWQVSTIYGNILRGQMNRVVNNLVLGL